MREDGALRRSALASGLIVTGFFVTSCTAADPGFQPDVPSVRSQSPAATTGSPEPIEPMDTHVPIARRLRVQRGVFEGTTYPRLQHWARSYAAAYRGAFALCDRIGLRDLAIQLHVRTTSPSVAVAVLDGFDRRVWRAAHQGCADGLIWDRREA